MASLNELKTRIASVQDTMKITNAMYMISNNKMRKARKAWQDTLPYFDTLESVLALALRHLPDDDAEHPFFDSRPEIPAEERKTGYIVITGDKGLAGAYHQNNPDVPTVQPQQRRALLYRKHRRTGQLERPWLEL